MIIDMHYHLDERMETTSRLLSQMDQYSIDRTVLIATMVDPFHVEGVAESLSRLARYLLTGSLSRMGLLIYESTVTKSGNFSILGKTYKIYQLPDNSAVASAIKSHPDRFFGWFFINPSKQDAVAELEKNISAPGWIGVKCHPFWHQYPVRLLDSVAAFCSQKNLPMLIHLGGNKENGDFKYLPDLYPDLKIIYAHAGVPHYKRLWDYAKNKTNVYMDLSSPYLDEDLRISAVTAMGHKKCLYGTDGPYGYPAAGGSGYDHGAIINEIKRLPLSITEKEGILGANFIKWIL